MGNTVVMDIPPHICGHWGYQNNRGGPCGASSLAGKRGCWRHVGKPLRVAKAEGNVVVELRKWGLDGHTDLADPNETLLRLLTQSAARVSLFAGMLQEAYDAAERLRAALEHERVVVSPDVSERGPVDPDDYEAEQPFTEDPAVQAARLDLRRIFAMGGAAALIGFKYDADRYGRVYAVEEAIRGLAKLEADERDRCAKFAKLAIDAGLGERMVRLAETQGALMASVFGRVHDRLVTALGLSADQVDSAKRLLPALLAEEIRGLTGQQAITQRTTP